MAAYKVGESEPAIILKDKNIFKDIKPTILLLWIMPKNMKNE